MLGLLFCVRVLHHKPINVHLSPGWQGAVCKHCALAPCLQLTGLAWIGNSSKGYIFGSLYMQLVCRSTLPIGKNTNDLIYYIRYQERTSV